MKEGWSSTGRKVPRADLTTVLSGGSGLQHRGAPVSDSLRLGALGCMGPGAVLAGAGLGITTGPMLASG